MQAIPATLVGEFDGTNHITDWETVRLTRDYARARRAANSLVAQLQARYNLETNQSNGSTPTTHN